MSVRARVAAVPRVLAERARAVARAAAKAPIDALSVVACVVVSLVVVMWPLFSARYPPMTDLPMHAAQTSTFRHWFDDAYHFRDQFELQPLTVPYDTSYVVGALLMIPFGAVTAVKLATGLLLLTLPVGLGVLSWGMRKSPLAGVFALPFIWCDLTHWGFINFVSALGQFALVVGLSLRAVDKPSRRTSVALAVALVVLFFTHIFRFPFAVAGVIGAAVVVYPATRRIRPILLPLVPALTLFAIFYFRRTDALGGEMGKLAVDWKRVAEIPKAMVNGFDDPNEMKSAWTFVKLLGAVEVVAVAAWVVGLVAPRFSRAPHPSPSPAGRGEGGEPPAEVADASQNDPLPQTGSQAWFDARFTWLATLVPIACAAVFFYLFLTLPMTIGIWWYVYPREVIAAAFVALAALPGLPRNAILKLLSIAAISVGALGFAAVSASGYAAFGRATEDFDRIQKNIPMAPKLLYLVFEHSGSNRVGAPFIHLPAWIQAEKGGWLSFHFAVWGASPVKLRTDDAAIVAPPVPPRWEWTPYKFRVQEHGPFFNWFLIRSIQSPDALFRDDATIVPVAHEGTWWLYKRDLSPVSR